MIWSMRCRLLDLWRQRRKRYKMTITDMFGDDRPRPPDFFKITTDKKLAGILDYRWQEISKCLQVQAHLAGIIIMGSILEGVLLAVVRRFPERALKATSAPKDKSGKTRGFDKWTLNDLIDVAHDCGWIKQEAREFSHTLRRYRNLVHIFEQKERDEMPDEQSCEICWEVVRTALYDLEMAG